MQQLCGAFGAAVLVVILAGQIAGQAGPGAAGLAMAFGRTFCWCVGFTALAVVPALLMPGRPPGGRQRHSRRRPRARTRRWPGRPIVCPAAIAAGVSRS